MFNRRSRYFKVSNQVILEEKNGAKESKSVRILPTTSGRFLHTVESSDRLDHLAYKYYKQSRHWWHICDANTDFYSPRQLLGKEPDKLMTTDLEWQGYLPPWKLLSNLLEELSGIDYLVTGGMLLGDYEVAVSSREVVLDLIVGNIPLVMQDELDGAVLVQQISFLLDIEMQNIGINLGGRLRFTKLADTIWQIEDFENEVIFQCLLASGPPTELNIYSSIVIHHWNLQIGFNESLINLDEIVDHIESINFTASNPALVGRVGKKIIIPPKFAG